MANTVRDRSGTGLPSKAERRALGKAAARKRAAARRRRELLNRAATVAAPIAVIAIIVAAVWFFSGGNGGEDPAASPTLGTSSSPEPAPAETFTLPPGADPALETMPVVTAGEGTLSELDVQTLIAGTGAAIQTGDVVTFNYVGVDYDSGEEFDSSWGGQPLVIPVGVGQLIQGWDEGLIGVTVGSRVQIDVPEALAYPNGNGPEGDLRFVVDILAIAE
jgi:peptidylprolyl isomerase